MASASPIIRSDDLFNLQAEGSIASRQVIQLPTGELAFLDRDAALGATTYSDQFRTRGKSILPKTAGVVLLPGQRAWWDHSAGSVTFRKVLDRDFFAGCVTTMAPSAQPWVEVDLNKEPRVDIDLARDGFQSVLVGTPAAGGFGYPVNLGGALVFELSATNEAQKVDALAVDGFAVGSNWILEGCFRVLSDGGAGSQDFSIGVASATHASDFTAIAEFVALHLDGNDLDIQVGSDDGVTDVPEADSTVQYAEGSALANRVHFLIDARVHTSCKIYINGVNVLGSTTFTLAAAAGPLFPIVHLEKAIGTDTYKIAVDSLRGWLSEQS